MIMHVKAHFSVECHDDGWSRKLQVYLQDSLPSSESKTNKDMLLFILTSVSDPFHFDMDPDPRIRFVK